MDTVLGVIALPAGSPAPGQLKLSLVVSPRLTGSDTLANYPDILDWTRILKSGQIKVGLRVASNLVNAQLDTTPLDQELWGLIFTRDTRVEPYLFVDRRGHLVISYRTRNALAAVKNLYQSVTTAAPGLWTYPGLGRLGLRSFRQESSGGAELEKKLLELRQSLAQRQASPNYGREEPQPLDPALSLGRVLTKEQLNNVVDQYFLFHRGMRPPPGPPTDAVKLDQNAILDFHRAWTALAAYPTIERALGLVVDVIVRAEEVPSAGVNGQMLGEVKVERFEPDNGWPGGARLLQPAAAVLYRHRTAAAGQPTVFAAADRPDANPPAILNGFLGLDPARYQLIGVDLDGAMIKLPDLAGAVESARVSPRAPAFLPALRSAGLSLAADNRAVEVIRSIARAGALNDRTTGTGKDPGTLEARDLVKGYRVDVWSSAIQQWRSLHRRHAVYRIGETGQGVVEADEEGFTQLAATSPASAPGSSSSSNTDLFVHERLVRWTGWSQSAPRPGRSLNRSFDAHRALEDDPTQGQPVTPFKMSSQLKPVGRSLPTLRFGTSYRFRVRAVDLAGNSPLPEADHEAMVDPGFPVALPPSPTAQPYLRFEPVPHPMLALHTKPSNGRPKIDRLVFRSFNDRPEQDAVTTPNSDDRHVLPPRTSVELAEAHGMLDAGNGELKGDPATLQMIVARNDARLLVIEIGHSPDGVANKVPISGDPIVDVPYLPDPIARAAALRGVPGMTAGAVADISHGKLAIAPALPDAFGGGLVRIPFGDQWPQRKGFRLVLAEGDRLPDWSEEQRALTVYLPKGRRCALDLSSVLSQADLELMGQWAWQRQFVEAANLGAILKPSDNLASTLEWFTRGIGVLTELSLQGGQWCLTPALTVELAHAVQQPLVAPYFKWLPLEHNVAFDQRRLRPARDHDPYQPLSCWRSVGSPDAVLVGGLACDYESSSRIDILASWTDVVDDGVSLAPLETVRSAPVVCLSLSTPAGAAIQMHAAGAEMQLALLRAGGNELWFAPERFEQGGSRPPAAPIHRIADTRHRMITYTAIATSRFEEDFPANQDLVFTRAGPPVVVDMPSSARPPPPAVRYIVPTFGWQRHRSTTLSTSVRMGRGLRVYLDRPWLASGADELLGVIVVRGEATPTDEEREGALKYAVTQWGLDPIRFGGHIAKMPRLADLPDAVRTGERLTHIEGGTEYDVAGHTVHFDPERQCWYADIAMTCETAYMPFVRLALVRYQPHSIAGMEMSPVALADFAQLTPDRSAMLVRDPSASTLYTLLVSGLAPATTAITPWHPTVEVVIERRRTDIGGDLGWEPATTEEVQVVIFMSRVNAPAALWAGTIQFAVPPPAGRYRVVIREYEIFEADRPDGGGVALSPITQSIHRGISVGSQAGAGRPARTLDAAVSLPGAGTPAGRPVVSNVLAGLSQAVESQSVARRLVYAEVMPIGEPEQAGADAEGSGSTENSAMPPPGVLDLPPDAEDTDSPLPWPPIPAPEPLIAPDWSSAPDLEAATDPTIVDGHVKLAQAMLNAAGAANPPLVIDGNFGDLTTAAVRSFRARRRLPDASSIDQDTWIALAMAAPFPRLEPGPKSPPMAGPPIGTVQRLLNIAMEGLIPETSVYDPTTKQRIEQLQDAALQQGRADIKKSGFVDGPTWQLLVEIMHSTEPHGTVRLALEFNRERATADSTTAVVLLEASTVDASPPPSDPAKEDWLGRPGLWIELLDINGGRLYRQRLGLAFNVPPESPSQDSESGYARAGDLPDVVTFDVVVPVMAAAKYVSIFGSTGSEPMTPSQPLGSWALPEFDLPLNQP